MNEDSVIIDGYISIEKEKLITVIKKRGIRIEYSMLIPNDDNICNKPDFFDDELEVNSIGSKTKINPNSKYTEYKTGYMLVLQPADKEDYQILDQEDYENHFNNINSHYLVYLLDENNDLSVFTIGTKIKLSYDNTIKLEIIDILKPRGITKFYKYKIAKG